VVVDELPAPPAGDGPLRLLLVHAHPDDETLTTGATMARYAAEGAQVVLVTCTRGERGEVIGPLRHLEGDGDALAAHRERELAAAVAALGVTDHRFLGADAGVRFRDSGMAWGEHGRAVAAPDTGDDAFARVPVEDAAAHLRRVVDEVRPHVVVTYDAEGGYGHPDHVRAHEVGVAATGSAAWTTPLVIAVASPRSVHEAGVARLRERGLTTLEPPWPSVVVPDAAVTHRVRAEAHRAAKVAALRAHATQVVVADDEEAYALSNGVWHDLTGTEWFTTVRAAGAGGPS
jgi:N-acetyl-1-D-myo-inositol-2-amino-2-deoxy-alpha-D-glucopyranoside deacetylase